MIGEVGWGSRLGNLGADMHLNLVGNGECETDG